MLDAGTYKMRPGIPELIAGIALSGIEGANGTGIRSDHPEDLKKRKNLSKGIKAEADEGKVVFDLDVNMEYGRDFMDLAKKIQRSVEETVTAMTGWDVVAVNVNVVGVNALQVNDPRSFGRRTLARMLACDILYQMDLTGDDPGKVIEDFNRMLEEGIEEEPVPPEEIPDISLEHVHLLLGSSAEIEELVAFGSASFDYPGRVPDFSHELVDVYLDNRRDIDDLLASYADRWSLERMPMVDRNLLRLGFTELLYRHDIPTNVTINEYLELAKAFSTEDSGKFINGVLGKLVRDRGLQGRMDEGGPDGG